MKKFSRGLNWRGISLTPAPFSPHPPPQKNEADISIEGNSDRISQYPKYCSVLNMLVPLEKKYEKKNMDRKKII